MKSRPFEVARLGELERFEDEFATIPVRIPLGIRAFGVNAYAAREEGGRIIEEHDELGAGAGHHEELYVVLSGRAVFTLGARRWMGADRLRPGRNPGRARLSGRLGGCVLGMKRPRHETGLLRRLQRALRRAEGGTGLTDKGTEVGAAEEAILAGDLRLLPHPTAKDDRQPQRVGEESRR